MIKHKSAGGVLPSTLVVLIILVQFLLFVYLLDDYGDQKKKMYAVQRMLGVVAYLNQEKSKNPVATWEDLLASPEKMPFGIYLQGGMELHTISREKQTGRFEGVEYVITADQGAAGLERPLTVLSNGRVFDASWAELAARETKGQ